MAKNTADSELSARANRISLPLTPDGTAIDWEHVRQSTSEKFLGLLETDPQIKEAYAEVHGPGDGETVSLGGGLTEENVAQGLNLICSLNALAFRVAAARFIKHPLLKNANTGRPLPLVIDQDVLDRAFQLTPEQHAELDPRATRLAQKYTSDLPDWVKKNMDLYIFASMFLTYTAQNAKTALSAQIERDLKRAQMAFHQAKANQPHNPKPDSDAQQPVNGHDRSDETYARDAIHNVTVDTPDTPTTGAPTV